MPVVNTSKDCMKAANGNKPDWMPATSVGVGRMPKEGSRFNCHYHACNEYLLIYKGKAKVLTEGREHYVRPGDIVMTKAGDEHDILEIYEDLEFFFYIDTAPEGADQKHLFRSPEKSEGHPVPGLPVPDDFPAE